MAHQYRVTTAAAGVDGRPGSGGTPPGVHVIAARIGADEPLGTVFRDRVPTGEVRPPAAAGAPSDPVAELILTRILTLDGREPGVNSGPGCDSLARYIYIHGTDDEARLGQAVSHGCVRLAGADVVALFDEVQAGDPVVILADRPLRYHFAGVAGSGMSALAQYHVLGGGGATGSDRAFDAGERGDIRARLEALGVVIVPQDGSALAPAGAPDAAAGSPAPAATPGCDALIVSSAVEETVPDVAAARRFGVPVLHRSELLARCVDERQTVAVAGTSGKSTVTAMIFEILRGCRRDPSVITGGELRLLQAEGLLGNAWAGRGQVLVIEADESDGSITRYAPWAGVLLNMQRDHKELAELAAIFGAFRRNVRGPFLIGEDENLAPFAADATRFGLCAGCAVRAQDVLLTPDGARFSVAGVRFTLPAPGMHNVRNAVAALAACQALGLRFAQMAAPLARFQGVARRFQTVGRERGVEVIDDFAHNPDKIGAALSTARARGRRILAVYQPHGFGPTRFLRDDLVAAFARGLRPTDRLYLPEIYFAGGTVTRDISSRDIATGVAARGVPALFTERREDIIPTLAGEAREGDVILVMGARDPSLTDFCRAILAQLAARGQE
ncbi:MAG: glutamate ligase domain-containing protein [Candidatus Krumholzibacteriia bacterium]